MPNSKKYNGYSSYNAWNISHWINYDVNMYMLAKECVEECETKEIASKQFMRSVGTIETPDGVPWTKTNVQTAMRDMR